MPGLNLVSPFCIHFTAKLRLEQRKTAQGASGSSCSVLYKHVDSRKDQSNRDKAVSVLLLFSHQSQGGVEKSSLCITEWRHKKSGLLLCTKVLCVVAG